MVAPRRSLGRAWPLHPSRATPNDDTCVFKDPFGNPRTGSIGFRATQKRLVCLEESEAMV